MDILRVPRLPHGSKWEVYSIGSDMPGSSSAPTSGSSASRWLQGAVLPPPTFVTGISGASVKGWSQSRWSQSPSRTSSRGSSASPGGGKHFSDSRFPSQPRQADEDRQEEQSLLDFLSVVASLCSLNGLPKASSESHKIRGFRAALEDDDQPAASYKLLIEDASVDINDRVSSASSGMHSQKVSKLLQYPGVSSRKFYRFEGED